MPFIDLLPNLSLENLALLEGTEVSAGGVDIAAAHLTEPVSKPTHAVAQMVIYDRRTMTVTPDAYGVGLGINFAQLGRREFLGGARLSSAPSATYDLKDYLSQRSIRAATAVLVEDDLVLVAGHSVVPRDISNTYFIFDRRADNDAVHPKNPGQIHVGNDGGKRVFRAKSICGWKPGYAGEGSCERGKRGPGDVRFVADWALVRLSESTGRSPIPLRRDVPTPGQFERSSILLHPLGIPIKQCAVASHPTLSNYGNRADESGVARVYVDFASGGSGGPLIYQHGGVWVVGGIATGNATFDFRDVAITNGRRVVRPRRYQNNKLDACVVQPITLANAIHC